MIRNEGTRIGDDGFVVGVLGATGAVGRTMLAELEARAFPVRSLRCFGAPGRGGRTLAFRGREIAVEDAGPDAFAGVQLLLSSVPSAPSRDWLPAAARAGALVVDNSSAFRMVDDVPLVVPEVNAHELAHLPRGIVANPNCCAIPLTIALKPLADAAGLRRVIVATYQSSSGRGAHGLAQLDAELAAAASGTAMPAATAHAQTLAGDVLPNDWPFDDDGSTEEERKIVQETRKILALPRLPLTTTTVRVPVRVAHRHAHDDDRARAGALRARRSSMGGAGAGS